MGSYSAPDIRSTRNMKRASEDFSSGEDTDFTDDESCTNTQAAEKPATKRQRIFEQLREQGLGRRSAPRIIRGADDLDEFELHECFKIVDGFVKAHSRDHHVTPALMEDFFNVVFGGGWTSTDDHHGATVPLDSIVSLRGINSVGVLTKDSEERAVVYKLELCMSPIPKVALKLSDKDGSEIGADELRYMKWHPQETGEFVRRPFEHLGGIEEDILWDNQNRAKIYARDMIRRRAKGEALPGTEAPHEFFDYVLLSYMCRAFQLERHNIPIGFAGKGIAEKN